MARTNLKVSDESDNVATALTNVDDGERVQISTGERSEEIRVREEIPFGHKVAIDPIDEGESVVKYGLVVGHAAEDIAVGDWVHVHNVVSNYGIAERPSNQ